MLCISTDFGRAGAELSLRKLWVTCRALEISSAQSHQLPSSDLEWAEMGRIALWTDAPSAQISCDTKEKFHAWCEVLSVLVRSFVLYSQRRKQPRLCSAKCVRTSTARCASVTQGKTRDHNSSPPVSKLHLHQFLWTSKRKDKNNWGTQGGLLPSKFSSLSLLAMHSACFEFH